MRMALLAAIAATPLLAGQALAECSVPRFSFSPNTQVEATMSTSSGQSCTVRLNASEQSRFDKVAIVARARHGTASAGVGGGVAYRSAAGYAGEDVFVFAVTGRMKTGNGTAKIRVTVSVAGDGPGSGAGAQAPQATRSMQPARARTAATKTKTDDLASARRACMRQHAGRYDPQTRITWYDKRYSSVYFECLAKRTGASKVGR